MKIKSYTVVIVVLFILDINHAFFFYKILFKVNNALVYTIFIHLYINPSKFRNI